MLVKWPQSDLASLRVVLRASFISKKKWWDYSSCSIYSAMEVFRTKSNSLKVALKLIEKTQTFFRICSRPQTMNTFLYLQKLSLTQCTQGLLCHDYIVYCDDLSQYGYCLPSEEQFLSSTWFFFASKMHCKYVVTNDQLSFKYLQSVTHSNFNVPCKAAGPKLDLSDYLLKMVCLWPSSTPCIFNSKL